MRLRPRHLVPLAFLVLGVLAAGWMMYVAWQHNPSGAFHGPDGVQWGAWLVIGVSWLLPFAVIAGIAMPAIWMLRR